MAHFYPLDVVSVRKETRAAVVVLLRPRPEDAARFRFVQGQYLTFRRVFAGVELRRSYSICAAAGAPLLRVLIKRVAGGAFSTWANAELRAGDVLASLPPLGHFNLPLAPAARRRYAAFAAGSGIAPVLSVIKTVLAHERQAHFTLVDANRRLAAIPFYSELADLAHLYPGRFTLLHVLSMEGLPGELLAGRLDAAKLEALLQRCVDAAALAGVFICCPDGLRDLLVATLQAHGVPPERIKYELFAAPQQGALARRAPPPVNDAEGGTRSAVTVTLEGAERAFSMDKGGATVLDAALQAGIAAPYACKAGVCLACQARVQSGRVHMAANYALNPQEVAAGFVLTCQSYPLTDAVALSFDE